MKEITIVIPSLNAARTIGTTLESLRALKDVADVIVVDSGSNDGTLEIIKSHSIELRYCEPGNMYSAINVGLHDAETTWVTYINADDILYGDILKSRTSNSKCGVDVSYGTVDFIDADGRFLRSWRPAVPTSALSLYQAGYSPILQQGALIRTSLYHELGGFNDDYMYVADSDFWFRAFESGANFCRHSKLSIAAFRLHGAQITQRLEGEMHAEHKFMQKQHLNERSQLHAMPHLLRWRLENAGSYVERWLRAARLGLRPIFCKSYELH